MISGTIPVYVVVQIITTVVMVMCVGFMKNAAVGVMPLNGLVSLMSRRTGQSNYISPIRSQAQFDMLTKVVTDPDYAAQRGIAQQTAAQMLLDHKQAGSPALVPGRVGDSSDKGPTPRLKKSKRRHGGLFGSR